MLNKRIAYDHMKFNKLELLDKVVDDVTVERKFERTYLGYWDIINKKEEIVFKQLDLLKDKF